MCLCLSDHLGDTFSNSSHKIGTIAEKVQIEEKQVTRVTPEPIIEEPLSPNLLQRVHSDILEESEIVENEEATKPQRFTEEEVPKPKSKRAKSIQIEEIEENDQFPDEPKTPVETEIPKRKASRAMSATQEDIQLVENKLIDTSHEVRPTEIERQQSQKGTKEDDQEDDEELEALLKRAQKQRSLVEELPKKSDLAEGTTIITQ